MNYSKETRNFASSLVNNFSKYDRLSESYSLIQDDLSDFDIDKLVGLIMSDNPGWANESIGPDNDKFDWMICSLQLYLKNSTDKDCEENFITNWKEGLHFYARKQIEKLLEDALEEFNHERAA